MSERREQLILTDETLRVTYAVLQRGRIAREFARARDPKGGGNITLEDSRDVLRVLEIAVGDPRAVITEAALRDTVWRYRVATARLDCRARMIGVFVWNDVREGPEPRRLLPAAITDTS
jgi:hypothetical protein